jgi:hypothetical protein
MSWQKESHFPQQLISRLELLLLLWGQMAIKCESLDWKPLEFSRIFFQFSLFYIYIYILKAAAAAAEGL